jgi:hypothetical protein
MYGPQQSRFARYLERRERERPDPVAHELRRRPGDLAVVLSERE